MICTLRALGLPRVLRAGLKGRKVAREAGVEHSRRWKGMDSVIENVFDAGIYNFVLISWAPLPFATIIDSAHVQSSFGTNPDESVVSGGGKGEGGWVLGLYTIGADTFLSECLERKFRGK
jgi:hypothetical protein